MDGSDLLVIVGLPLAALGAAIVFGVMLPRRRRHHRRNVPFVIAPFNYAGDHPPRPVLNEPLGSPLGGMRQPMSPQATPYGPPAQRPPYQAPYTLAYNPTVQPPTASASAPAAPTRESRESREPRESREDREAREARDSWMPAPPRREVATGTDGALRPEPRAPSAAASPAESHNLRLEHTPDARPALKVHRPPTDGTLQFLPGRMEIIEGRDIGQEIRFVRQPGAAHTEITFGRTDGVQYRHVQLHEPTVSRLHAKITQEDKRWRLTNLSKTNPVVVNGRPLEGEGASHLLNEGDRVEMGEVALRFRAK